MENEIDYKKLESCMIELFGDPSWNMYGKSNQVRAKFVTTNGLVISSPNERKATVLPDTTMAVQFKKLGRDVVDKEVCLALELGIDENDPMGGNHMALIEWVIGLYVTKYVIKQSDSSEFKSSEACRIRNIILDPLWKEQDKTAPVWYLKKDKTNIHVSVEGPVDPENWIQDNDILDDISQYGPSAQHFNYNMKVARMVFSERGNTGLTLNIESHHPLTSSQRRFFLGVIEGLNMSPDNIYIDDYSESAQRKKNNPKLRWELGNPGGQCVKRQLGLHFF
jgi:hypothetical protein